MATPRAFCWSIHKKPVQLSPPRSGSAPAGSSTLPSKTSPCASSAPTPIRTTIPSAPSAAKTEGNRRACLWHHQISHGVPAVFAQGKSQNGIGMDPRHPHLHHAAPAPLGDVRPHGTNRVKTGAWSPHFPPTVPSQPEIAGLKKLPRPRTTRTKERSGEKTPLILEKASRISRIAALKMNADKSRNYW